MNCQVEWYYCITTPASYRWFIKKEIFVIFFEIVVECFRMDLFQKNDNIIFLFHNVVIIRHSSNEQQKHLASYRCGEGAVSE